MIDELGGEAPRYAHLLQSSALSDGAASELLANLAEAVVISDTEGRITFWNSSAERLFGWPAEDALDRSLDLIIPAKHRDRHWRGYREVMDGRPTKYSTRLLEVPALHREGRTLSISFTVTLIYDVHRVAGIAAVVRDETERWNAKRRLEQQLAMHVPILDRRGTLHL